MISPTIQEKIDHAQHEEHRYWPVKDVLQTLASKEFVMLVGPSAIGKSTLMNEVVKLDKEFARVKNMTTRPKRDNDEEGIYEYIPHTDQGLAQILEQIGNGKLVQYAVHPTTGFIYGTYPENYPGIYNMLDTQSQVASSLSQLPFRRTHIIGIVTDPDAWKKWFLDRNKKNTPEYEKRIDEAIQSLEWLTAQPANAITWIYNHPNDKAHSAKELIAAVKDTKMSDSELRDTALTMLYLAYQMKG
jgi:guanylate kinase